MNDTQISEAAREIVRTGPHSIAGVYAVIQKHAREPDSMRRVIIESPYAGNIIENTRYARACMADAIRRGESPYASHLLYTQPGVLRDADPAERKRGIEAGFAWADVADAIVFYRDLGMSPGMKRALAVHREAGRNIAHRQVPGWVSQEATTIYGGNLELPAVPIVDVDGPGLPE